VATDQEAETKIKGIQDLNTAMLAHILPSIETRFVEAPDAHSGLEFFIAQSFKAHRHSSPDSLCQDICSYLSPQHPSENH